MISPYTVFVGFDQREAIAYHTCCQSLIENSSVLLNIVPLSLNCLNSVYTELHADNSNDFIYSRFLAPYLLNFQGFCIYLDGDMVVETDIKLLFDEICLDDAVSVVKHDYKTKCSRKYLGNRNEDYPRKNWSSVIVWNCAHPSNKVLTPDYISRQPGSFLHRFNWLSDDQIGSVGMQWNWLADEYPENPESCIVHYTLGTPCFKEYSQCSQSERWHHYNRRVNEGMDA